MRTLTTTFVVALCVLPVTPAFAQVQAQSTSSSGYNSASGAPVFSIPNFQGDARSGDLYYYMHQQQFPQWDDYRKKLQQDAQKIVNMQPTQQSPSPQNLTGSGQGSQNQVNSIATAANGLGQGSATNTSTMAQQQSGAQQTQQQVSTNVQGTVLTPGVSVPGLVDP